jgi:hypothetical protein
MNKKQTLKKLNKKIDEMIISGNTKNQEYRRLIKLHKLIAFN